MGLFGSLAKILTAMGVATFIMIAWLWSTPMTLFGMDITITAGNQSGTEFSHITQGISLLQLIIQWWGPLLVLAVFVVWGLVQAYERDPNSEPM